MDHYLLCQYESQHEKLHTGSSLILGKIHWHILKAHNMMSKLCEKEIIITKDKRSIHDFFIPVRELLTDFGNEVVGKEIHWWVYQRETDIEDLRQKTESVLEHLERLKKDAYDLRNSFDVSTYEHLIEQIKKFADDHHKEINALYNYILYLKEKDILAPCILFSRDVWASTRVSERTINISKSAIDDDTDNVKICSEIALGIRTCLRPHIKQAYSDLQDEYSEVCSINQNRLITQTSYTILDELGHYFENIRNSLRKIVIEIDQFNAEPTPIVRTIRFGERQKDRIRFCLVQLDFSVKFSPRLEPFYCSLNNEAKIKEKVFKFLEFSKENNADVIVFPELSISKKWIDEIIGRYDQMVIVGGSYYEDRFNICPIIIDGKLINPPYAKCSPSPFEIEYEEGRGMKGGKILYNFQTPQGNFSVLNCIDYANFSNKVLQDGKIKLDYILNPCYDHNIKRFDPRCNSDCEDSNVTIIRVNKAENLSEKGYGGSGIICKDHTSFIQRYTSDKWRDEEDVKYRIINLKNEQIIVVEIDFANIPPVSSPTRGTLPRINIIKELDQ